MTIIASLSRSSFSLQLKRSISTAPSISFKNTEDNPEVLGDHNHRHARYILQSGLNYLKQRDINELKASITNRGLSIDVDELVSNILGAWLSTIDAITISTHILESIHCRFHKLTSIEKCRTT